MSTDLAYNAAYALLGDSFLAADNLSTVTVPLLWPNQPYQEPQSGPWIQVEMAGNDLSPVSTGNGLVWRETGQIWLHCFTPARRGDILARAILRQIGQLIRRRIPIQDLTATAMNVGMGEQGEDTGKWWRISMCVDWYIDDPDPVPAGA